MKATDIISFIKVSEDVVENKKKELYKNILDAANECSVMFALSQEDILAVRAYCCHYRNMPMFLYEKLNKLAIEDGKAFVRIWVANGEEYLVPPTELPKGYFKSIITILNYE